jgi:4-amino-4-deoxy-L-arabinose transferase-like glycosyltransferase
MRDSASSSGQSSRSELRQKVAWTFLILATLYVCYFSHLGAIGLVGPDEPRYAWIARDMAESNDWVTPRLYGQPWFEKPALYYWGAALCFKLFGVSEATARLPSAMAALFATLALAWLAFRFAGRAAARWLLVLLPSCIAMIGFSHAAAPDMLFSATLTMAMVCAAAAIQLASRQIPIGGSGGSGQSSSRVTSYSDISVDSHAVPIAGIQTSKRPWLVLLLFGFFLGAAALAKGPAAVILAGSAVLLWSVLTKRWRDALRLFHPIGIAAFLLTSLPWYILCARRNADFLHVFIIEHNFHRYLTPQFQHSQPFWYYLPITFLALLPWTFWLAAFARREERAFANPSQREQLLFVTCWGVFPLLFFSLSKSKLPGYILPAIPPLMFAITLAVARRRKSSDRLPQQILRLLGLLYIIPGVWLAVADLTTQSGNKIHWAMAAGPAPVHILTLFLGAGGLAIIGATRRDSIVAMKTAVIVTLLILLSGYNVTARLDSQLSARNCAAQLLPSLAQNTYSFKLQRGWKYQLNFYLHREIMEWSPEIPGPALVVTNDKNLPALERIARIDKVVWDGSAQAEIVVVTPLSR